MKGHLEDMTDDDFAARYGDDMPARANRSAKKNKKSGERVAAVGTFNPSAGGSTPPSPAPFTPQAGAFYDDLPNEQYHGGPGHSSTSLRLALSMSPWFAHEARRRGMEPTEPMKFGTMMHYAILEPEKLSERVCLLPGFNLRKKDEKAEFERLEAEAIARGQIVIRKPDEAVAQLQADVHSHPLVQRILKAKGNVERSYYWRDEESGLLLKRRPDLEIVDWSDSHGLIVDLKSAQDCRIPAFAKCIARYGYAQQAAQYVAGFEAHYGKPAHFAWIVVTSKAPHEVAIHFADRWLPHGEDQFRKSVELVARCERTGHFPRIYGGKAVVIDMPAWAEATGEDDE